MEASPWLSLFYQLFFSPNMILLALALCFCYCIILDHCDNKQLPRPFQSDAFQKEWHNYFKTCLYFSAFVIPSIQRICTIPLAEMQPQSRLQALIVPPLSNSSSYMRVDELERCGRIQYVRRWVPSCYSFRKVSDWERFYFLVSQWFQAHCYWQWNNIWREKQLIKYWQSSEKEFKMCKGRPH